MSDWQVGDLALCVKNGREQRTVSGRVYKVLRVIPNAHWNDNTFDTALTLAGVKHTTLCGGSWHGRFRKVTPKDADEFDRETIELMNRVGEPVQ